MFSKTSSIEYIIPSNVTWLHSDIDDDDKRQRWTPYDKKLFAIRFLPLRDSYVINMDIRDTEKLSFP